MFTHQTRDGDGRPVGSAHEEPLQDNLVEGSIRATCQEPVQLQTPSITLDWQNKFNTHNTKILVPEGQIYILSRGVSRSGFFFLP